MPARAAPLRTWQQNGFSTGRGGSLANTPTAIGACHQQSLWIDVPLAGRDDQHLLIKDSFAQIIVLVIEEEGLSKVPRPITPC
jgi:hypothetical protein